MRGAPIVAWVLVAMALASMSLHSAGTADAERSEGRSVRIWMSDPALPRSSGDFESLRQPDATFVPRRPSDPSAIEVDDGVAYQTIDGFGASLTDSSAHLIANHPQRDDLMRTLFDPAAGIGISLLRQPIGATDYTASGFYSLDDVAPGAIDLDLSAFSIDHDRAEILPLLRQAIVIAPRLTIMATPWSAPAWMKDNGSLATGRLDPAFHQQYAEYIARFVESYRAEGVPIGVVTPVSEPVSTTGGEAPHMNMTREQQRDLLRDHLGPHLATLDPRLRVLGFDDNFSPHPDFDDYAQFLLADPGSGPVIDGVAGHCYFGGFEDMTALHEEFPEKGAWVTECSNGIEDAHYYLRSIDALIDATRNWAKGVVLWNIALDQDRGPTTDGCERRCTPLVTIGADATLTYEPDFYALGHFSRFVRPGARRVGSANPPWGATVAFRNADQSLVLIARNRESTEGVITLRWQGRQLGVRLPAGATATLAWAGEPVGCASRVPAVRTLRSPTAVCARIVRTRRRMVRPTPETSGR